MGSASLQKNGYVGLAGPQAMMVLGLTTPGWITELKRINAEIPGQTQPAKSRSQPAHGSLRLLVRDQAGSPAAEVQSYACCLGCLLSDDPQSDRVSMAFDTRKGETGLGYDLIICGEPRQSWAKCWLFGSSISSVVESAPTSLLVARQPRWPLSQILLVIRSEEIHGSAAGWTARLARASGAAITVLALIPQISPVPSREVRLQQELALLLAHHLPLERQIAYVSQQLAAEGLKASLRLRQGSPGQQIRAELEARSYDLIVIAAESKDWWLRRVLGESVEPLLDQADCPVLVAKPL